MSCKYADEIFIFQVTSYAAAIGDSFFIKHGNARSHTARTVYNMLEMYAIQPKVWPTCLAHLKLFEHILDTLGRRIAMRQMTHLIV